MLNLLPEDNLKTLFNQFNSFLIFINCLIIKIIPDPIIISMTEFRVWFVRKKLLRFSKWRKSKPEIKDKKKSILIKYFPIIFIYTPIKFNITSFFQSFVTFSSFVSIFILLCDIPWLIKKALI